MKQFSRNPLQAEFKPHHYYYLRVFWDITTLNYSQRRPPAANRRCESPMRLRLPLLWGSPCWKFSEPQSGDESESYKCSESLSPRSGHGRWARSVGHQSWLSLSLAGCGLPAWVVVTVTVPWPCVTVALPSARVQTWTVNHIELEVPSQLEVEVSSSMTRMIPVTVTVVASHCAPAPRASGAQAHRRCDGGTGNFKFEQLWVLLNSLRLRADSGRGSSSRLSWPSDGSSKRL